MMKWASMLVVLVLAGCGAVDTLPPTNFDVIMEACGFITRESVLQSIEIAEELRNLGFTFRDQVGFLDESDCG